MLSDLLDMLSSSSESESNVGLISYCAGKMEHWFVFPDICPGAVADKFYDDPELQVDEDIENEDQSSPGSCHNLFFYIFVIFKGKSKLHKTLNFWKKRQI